MTSPTRKMAADPHPELADAVAVTRFWRLVSRTGIDECWHWMGDTNKGYGVFYFRQRMHGAHELALSFTTGEKRHPSLETCHSCDNPICVNPSHLRFDTRSSNMLDMVSRNRAPKANRKLTDEQIVFIRERRSMGARQIDLAKQFGVSDGQISMIVRGHRWPELGGPIQTKNEHYRKAA